MDDKERTKISRYMSLVLRHAPEKAGITLDKNGWADVKKLISGINKMRHTNVTLEDIKEVVETNDKQRYKFNDDYTKIRANQGHSVSVDIEMAEKEPPEVLYHGTAYRFINSIKAEGLKPKSRLYVHLSADTETAVNVGKRHGSPVVLTIDTAKMHEDGYKFYLSENGVWQTLAVPAEYIYF
jgi:putative RNA 2'-phosphotransferase